MLDIDDCERTDAEGLLAHEPNRVAVAGGALVIKSDICVGSLFVCVPHPSDKLFGLCNSAVDVRDRAQCRVATVEVRKTIEK